MSAEGKARWIEVIVIVVTLIVSMLGFGMAYEHRTTVLEQTQTNQKEIIQKLETNQSTLTEAVTKLTTMMDSVNKRHDREDRELSRATHPAR